MNGDHMLPRTIVNTQNGGRQLRMSGAPSLSLALQWLMVDNGLSEQELAAMSGVSPGAVVAFLGRPHTPTVTWMTLVSAMRCQLAVKAPKRILSIAMPRITARRRSHEHRQWETRRLAAYRAQIVTQSPHLSSSEVRETARGYLRSSTARLAGDLDAAQQRLTAARVDVAAVGLRAAARAIAATAAVNAEDLALLAGLSLGAAQAVLDTSPDGRLATPHRLFSALSARLVIHPAGGGAVAIDLAPSGDWRPEAPRPGHSSLTHEDIRSRAGRGEALASIARDAGVSRQRIHTIVNASPAR